MSIAYKTSIKAALVASTSLSTVLFPSASIAQETVDAAAEAANAVQGETTNEPERILDVVVTAQKRKETVQVTPLAITALDARILDQSGIKDAQGLTAIVPNVAVRPFNNSIIIATRGISNENTSNLGDASLAFHVNGVYVGRPRAASALFYDLERVEFLRGPQGTLYGRNSTAGALNIITKRPELDEFSGGGDVAYGNYDSKTVRGFLNVPLSEHTAIRASAYFAERDGFAINNRSVPPIPLQVGPAPAVAGPNALITATNAANLNIPKIEDGDDDGEFSGRLSFLYSPSDQLSWVVTGQYQKTDEVGQVRSIIDTPGYFAVGGPSAGQLFLPQQQDQNDPRIYSLNTQPTWEVENWDVTSEVTYELSDALELTMINSIREDESFIRVDAAGAENLSAINSPSEARQVSHEIRVGSSGGGPVTWLIGGYYFEEEQSDSLFINNTGGGPTNVVGGNPDIKTVSLAAFGQATVSITDQLRLTFGGRHSDRKSVV